MFLKDVLKKCKELGYPVTASGLYVAGYKYGFLVKQDGCRNLVFDKEKFFDWIKKAKAEIPNGWTSVRGIADTFGISISKAYYLCNLPQANGKYYGAGKGILYVEIDKIKEIIAECERLHSEEW